MKIFNSSGLCVFLLSPLVLWIAAAFGPGKISYKTLRVFNEWLYGYLVFFLAFAIATFVMWQIAKRLYEPKLSEYLMLVVIGLFSLKGMFGTFMSQVQKLL